MVEGEAVTICCAHGDTVLYPIADVSMVVDGVPLQVQAAVSGSPPVAVLLGTDVPELSELLGRRTIPMQECKAEALIVTRAKARQQEEEAKCLNLQSDPKATDQPHLGEGINVPDMKRIEVGVTGEEGESLGILHDFDFAEDLFCPGHERRRLNRREKRDNKNKYST